MVTLSQISVRVGDIKSFKGLLEVYEDLAAQKMQKLRGDIAKYRDFAKTLAVMSGELEDDIVSVVKKKTKQKAVLLMSSDKGLYGSVFDEVGKQFTDYLIANDTDAYVVGSVGMDIIKQRKLQDRCVFVQSDELSLVKLWQTLGEYQEINVYHLKYDSLARQSVDRLRVSGDLFPKLDEDYEYNKEKKLKYIYEPSVSQVAEIFAKEVLSFLTAQTMKESDLAKHAARLMYLDSCLERNNDNLIATLKQKMVLTKRQSNKRQNARMASYLARNTNN